MLKFLASLFLIYEVDKMIHVDKELKNRNKMSAIQNATTDFIRETVRNDKDLRIYNRINIVYYIFNLMLLLSDRWIVGGAIIFLSAITNYQMGKEVGNGGSGKWYLYLDSIISIVALLIIIFIY